MSNELIFFIEVIAVFSGVLLFKKLFGKIGVIAWVAIATVLANIITAKTVDLFGLSNALGTVLFASTFLATDILNECYGKKDAKKAVYIGLLSNIVLIASTQITLLYIPSEIDYANEAMQTLFSLNLRIAISSTVMYFASNMLDVILFDKIKKKTKGKMLWLRNNISTILCNCVENFLFIGFAFYKVYDISTILIIALSTSVIEVIVAICDTPFLYLAKKIKDFDGFKRLNKDKEVPTA